MVIPKIIVLLYINRSSSICLACEWYEDLAGSVTSTHSVSSEVWFSKKGKKKKKKFQVKCDRCCICFALLIVLLLMYLICLFLLDILWWFQQCFCSIPIAAVFWVYCPDSDFWLLLWIISYNVFFLIKME